MASGECVVTGRFLFDEGNGGVWRIAVELAPGRVAFVSVPDRVVTLRGLRRIDCRIAQTSRRGTSHLEILHPDGSVLFERELYVPEEAWRPLRSSGPSVGA